MNVHQACASSGNIIDAKMLKVSDPFVFTQFCVGEITAVVLAKI